MIFGESGSVVTKKNFEKSQKIWRQGFGVEIIFQNMNFGDSDWVNSQAPDLKNIKKYLRIPDILDTGILGRKNFEKKIFRM